MLNWNPVMKAKYEALVAGAEESARAAAGSARPGSARAAQAARTARAARAKARVACAASLLRWIYFMTVHGAGWDPVAASGGRFAPQEAHRLPDQRKRARVTLAGAVKDHPPPGRGGRARMPVGGTDPVTDHGQPSPAPASSRKPG